MPDPSAKEIRDRLTVLTRLVDMTAEAVADTYYKRHGRAGAISSCGAVTKAVLNQAYWRAVKRFKKQNGFPNGHRINQPKKAALTALVAARAMDSLFIRSSERVQKSHVEYCLLRFTAFAMQAFMDLHEADVSPDQKRHLLVCLLKLRGKISQETVDIGMHLLCIYMDTFWQRRLKRKPLPDDSVD